MYNAEYADCNGEYDVTEETVSWAPDRRVYAHKTKQISSTVLLTFLELHLIGEVTISISRDHLKFV